MSCVLKALNNLSLIGHMGLDARILVPEKRLTVTLNCSGKVWQSKSGKAFESI